MTKNSFFDISSIAKWKKKYFLFLSSTLGLQIACSAATPLFVAKKNLKNLVRLKFVFTLQTFKCESPRIKSSEYQN